MFLFASASLWVISCWGAEIEEQCADSLQPIRAQSLLQTKQSRSAAVHTDDEDDEAAFVAWSANAYGDCVAGCGPDPVKFRSVQCFDVFAKAPSSACTGAKPASWEPCACGLEVCKSVEAKECPEATAGQNDTGGYERVGCFDFTKPKALPVDMPYEETCKTWTSNDMCLGGLPFYASVEDGTDPDKCFSFCLSKAMDLFGIQQDGKVCRCGASALNEIVWHEAAPRPGLAFRPTASNPNCPIEVYRYAGHYRAGGTPSKYWTFKEGDLQYADSIATGKVHRIED